MKTIFVHGGSRTHWLRVCRGFILPVITCFALVAACGYNGCSRLSDMDDDKVADAIDNCPATANTDQADTDGNGVGDACQGEGLATGESLGYSTAEGVAEARFDQRLRSVQIVSPGQVATLVWSDDSSNVDVELVLNRIRTTSSTPVDFSDATLLAALDDAEDEGADVAVYRQYVADHPGHILQIVTGQQPPSSASKHGRLEQQQQVLNPNVEKYLHRLQQAVLICRATAWAFNLQTATAGPELLAHYEALVRHFADLAREIERVYSRQQEQCITCTVHCNIDCGVSDDPSDKVPMACCVYDYLANSVQCFDTDEEDCRKNQLGEFHEGFGCADIDYCQTGACCIDIDDPDPAPPDFNQKPVCSKASLTHCNQAGDPEGPGLVLTEFYVGRECSEISCEE